MDIVNYSTIKVTEQRGVVTIQLFRPEAKNSINDTLLNEVMSVLTDIEKNTGINVIVLEGLPDNFCTGMDFGAVNEKSSDSILDGDSNEYYRILNYFSSCSKT